MNMILNIAKESKEECPSTCPFKKCKEGEIDDYDAFEDSYDNNYEYECTLFNEELSKFGPHYDYVIVACDACMDLYTNQIEEDESNENK